MATSATFTPLYGARTDAPACCYLLELDGCTLLLDCGWDSSFDAEGGRAVSMLAPLADVAPRVDAVLLSHADVAHTGALPYARKHLGLRAPIYATLPVHKMGQMALYDAHASAKRYWPTFDDDRFSLEDVHNAFQAVQELKYSQLTHLPGGTTIAPHAAGHTIGGCVWDIKLGAEEIVYCPEYNHQRERHLPAGALERFSKPSLLIAPARNTLVAADRAAPKQLTDYAMAAIARGGDVLIPSDAAGRTLELLAVLEAHWRTRRELASVPVALLHTQVGTHVRVHTHMASGVWRLAWACPRPCTCTCTRPTAVAMLCAGLQHDRVCKVANRVDVGGGGTGLRLAAGERLRPAPRVHVPFAQGARRPPLPQADHRHLG